MWVYENDTMGGFMKMKQDMFANKRDKPSLWFSLFQLVQNLKLMYNVHCSGPGPIADDSEDHYAHEWKEHKWWWFENPFADSTEV